MVRNYSWGDPWIQAHIIETITDNCETMPNNSYNIATHKDELSPVSLTDPGESSSELEISNHLNN